MVCTKAYGNLLSIVTKVTTDRGDPMSNVIPVMNWNKDLLDADHWIHDNCKDTSYYRKLATKTVYIQQEELHEHWGQAWDKPHQQQVQWHEHRHAQDAQHLSMHWERVVFVTLWCWVTCTIWLKFSVPSCHPCTCASLLKFTSLTLYFDLSFTILSHFFLLMHFEQHTELDNLITMQNLRTSANKGCNDAYDVHTSLTGYEPNDMVFSQLGDSQGSFSYITPSSDLDVDDATLGKLLTEAHRGQADYCDPEGVSVSQSSLSVAFDRTGKPVGERDVDQSIGFGVTRNTYSAHSKFSENTQAEKVVDRTGKPVGENSLNAQIRTLLDEQRQMIIAEYCEKIGHHELQAARAEEERRILREELWRQQMDFREVHQQSITEMKEIRKFQSSTFDTLARRKLVEDQNTTMELSGRVQELQNEINCMNDSKDFQDAESVRSGNSHVTSRPVSFPKHPILEGMWRPSFVSPRRKEGPPCIWETHGISGNVFANPHASSSAPYPQELNPWCTTIEEPLHMSTAGNSERPEQNRDLRCQSGPSAKDSVIFSGGDSSKNYGADQQRLQISDLHFDKFPTPATFACWKIRFKTEVCTCSQFLTEAMQWIKEVELVDSVDDLRSSSSTRGISMPNFEVLDPKDCFSIEQNHP